MPEFYAVITETGLQRLANAQMSGIPLVFTDLAVGDGGGSPITPASEMLELVNERYRVGINSVTISPDAPDTVRIEGIVPTSAGGFTIREAGLFNALGELIVVASYPPIYKPQPAEGALVDEYIRILVQYAAVEAVSLTVDPAVITATRHYVDERTAGGLWLWENFT